MNIFVVGTRGIPHIQGGVETHCEELYTNFPQPNDLNITIIRRSPYTAETKDLDNYSGVNLKTIYSPTNKSLEAIVHTFLAVLYAGIKRPDIIHIHAVGPSLFAPLAKLLGLKVVMTHHGPDYQRKKWGKMARLFLKNGERMGVRFADKVIVISNVIGRSITAKYGRNNYDLIYNGVPHAVKNYNTDYIVDQLGLQPGRYIFVLGRFVPEKGFDYLINAYKKSSASRDFKLVIAGDADHETEYSRKLRSQAESEGVVLTGFIKHDKLRQLFTNARLFIIPSFYEGLPIALLEAMSYDLDILASDIESNSEVGLPASCYFKTGDEDILAAAIEKKLSGTQSNFSYDLTNYSWPKIARQTHEVYNSLMKKK